MSDLDDLIDAARAKPTSGPLRIVVAVASYLIAEAAPAAALPWTQDQEGSLALLRARALVALGRDGEARDSYIAPLALFPHLRDAELDERIATAQARTTPTTGSPARDGSEAGNNVVSITTQRRGGEPRPETAAVAPSDPLPERIGFDQVGGLEEVKSQIRRRIILPFERKGLFERFKKRAGGGVLLYGPPGCGKTLMQARNYSKFANEGGFYDAALPWRIPRAT